MREWRTALERDIIRRRSFAGQEVAAHLGAMIGGTGDSPSV